MAAWRFPLTFGSWDLTTLHPFALFFFEPHSGSVLVGFLLCELVLPS
jgi:hypothetical protein